MHDNVSCRISLALKRRLVPISYKTRRCCVTQSRSRRTRTPTFIHITTRIDSSFAVTGVTWNGLSRRRNFSLTALTQDEVKDVAILGGGIAGLATAHYLSEEYPDAKVTLYESKPYLGGWMNSKVVDVGNGQVIFESGPRSLRPQAPNGTLALRLVRCLCYLGSQVSLII